MSNAPLQKKSKQSEQTLGQMRAKLKTSKQEVQLSKSNAPFQNPPLREAELTLIAENASLKGVLQFEGVTRIHGKIEGQIHCAPRSQLIFGETSHILGELEGEQIRICGYFEGKIRARVSIVLAPTARMKGTLEAPVIQIEPGAFFEGELKSGAPAPSPQK